MSTLSSQLPVLQRIDAEPLRVNPFVHVGDDRIYNPVSDVSLHAAGRGHRELRQLLAGEIDATALPPELRRDLKRDAWLVPASYDGSQAFRLKYVSLEAHTVCNQSCYFCPVSVAPRDAYFMPDELYDRILDQVAAHAATIDGVFMINYNEPTVDKRFVEQVRAIKERGLPPAVLTNGSGLTPDRIDALCGMGGLRFLSINLSTIDGAKYARDRGIDQVPQILRNLDYAGARPVAEEMEIAVLGEGDDDHERSYDEIRRRFAGSRFRIESRRLMDRAGYLTVGDTVSTGGGRLCGCENIGSRPLQHVHITPHGKCVLCCEDYDENYVVGDLSLQSLDAILRGDTFARLRRWAYGIEPAPDDFICRNCVYALSR